MLAILDSYKKHQCYIYLAHNQLLQPYPLVEEYSETDEFFMEQKGLNQKKSKSRLEGTLYQSSKSSMQSSTQLTMTSTSSLDTARHSQQS